MNKPESGPIIKPNATYEIGKYRYEIYKIKDYNIQPLRDRFYPFESSFGYESSFIIHEKAKRAIRRGGKVIFARTAWGIPKDVGALAYESRIVNIGEEKKKFLNMGVRAVYPEHQQRNIGEDMAKLAVITEMPDVISGEIRTWRIQKSNENTNFFIESYPVSLPGGDQREGRPKRQRHPFSNKIKAFLNKALRPSEKARLDMNTGLITGFPQQTSDRFIAPANNPDAEEIEHIIREIAKPEKGQGVRYVMVTDKDAVKAAEEAGFPRKIESSHRFLSALKSILPGRIGAILGSSR